MRRLMTLLGLLVVVLLGATLVSGCSTATASTQTLGATEWVAATQQPGTTIVDVRTPAEYAAGHIQGAVNIDVEDSGFDTQIASLDKNAPYALYCRSGRRSAIAAQKMADAGFTEVDNAKVGLADLQAAGAPVVTG